VFFNLIAPVNVQWIKKEESQMKRILKNLGVVAFVVVMSFIILQIPALAGFRGPAWGGEPMKKMVAALGLTEDQKLRIKEILIAHKPAIQPVRKQFILERRALRDLIQSESGDESTIKAQVVKVSVIAGEMAVQRARVYQEVRTILTAEQIQKFMELQKARDLRMDESISRGPHQIP
jgi:Spy/CpxP family protein refolding chaperone